MVLYFPVSALVTLFGNILQNPLDPRARSDTKLMNVVVNFLSTLGAEAETGGVHRMLGVCSEFERIARVVIEKAEKDHASRRKRKNADQSSSKNTTTTSKPANASFNPNATAPTSRPATANSATPQPSHGTSTNNNRHLSPQAADHRSPSHNGYSHGHTPMAGPGSGTMSQSPSPGMAPTGWHNEFSPPPSADTGAGSDYGSYAEMAGFGPIGAMNAAAGIGMTSPPVGGGGEVHLQQQQQQQQPVFFQQPMLPPDLFSLPMTLDWDWAEMSGGAYPSVENGNFGG
jgi:hypothetical protein